MGNKKVQDEEKKSGKKKDTSKGNEGKAESAKVKPVKRAENIVRIMSVDLDSTLSIYNALRNIKGLGFRAAHAVLSTIDADPNVELGSLTPEQIKEIEEAVKNANFPKWMKNTSNGHIVMSDIDLKKRTDINLLQKTRAYRGIRHERGLPVRGQRTRSSFRKNKTVGVVKKKAIAAKQGK